MKIYNYHHETGEFISEGQADESPLEPGVWIIPAHATTDEPPVIPEGKEAANIGGSWVLRDIPAPVIEPKQTQTEVRAAEIRGRLAQIDVQSVRPARAVALELANGGAPDAGDIQRLAALEAEADALRAELASM